MRKGNLNVVLFCFKKGVNEIKTRCNRCRKLIEYGNSHCPECASFLLKKRKEGIENKYVESTTKSARWKRVREEVIRRDKGNCVACLLKGRITYRKLQVHHIVKRVDNVDLIYEKSNLVTLCRECHEEFELMSPSEQLRILGDFNKEETHYLL